MVYSRIPDRARAGEGSDAQVQAGVRHRVAANFMPRGGVMRVSGGMRSEETGGAAVLSGGGIGRREIPGKRLLDCEAGGF